MNKKKRLVILGLIILFIGGSVLFFILSKEETQETEKPVQKYYSKLTGIEVSKAESEKPILGVMIENSEAARPQTGLDEAGIVFEAVTEGGITRYSALYQEKVPEIVGPVRSVRAHFVDWLMSFNASIAHVGGSSEALELIDQRKAKSLNQFSFSGPYYRDDSREAPHNMYARTKDLVQLQLEENHSKADFEDFKRKDESPAAAPTGNSVQLDFSGPEFAVEFRYDKATNSYIRYLGGVPHINPLTNQPISVKNFIVMKAVGLENGVKTTGKGEALVFNNGEIQTVSWELADYNNRIAFVDEKGSEIALIRGQTWISAISVDRSVIYN